MTLRSKPLNICKTQCSQLSSPEPVWPNHNYQTAARQWISQLRWALPRWRCSSQTCQMQYWSPTKYLTNISRHLLAKKRVPRSHQRAIQLKAFTSTSLIRGWILKTTIKLPTKYLTMAWALLIQSLSTVSTRKLSLPKSHFKQWTHRLPSYPQFHRSLTLTVN